MHMIVCCQPPLLLFFFFAVLKIAGEWSLKINCVTVLNIEHLR